MDFEKDTPEGFEQLHMEFILKEFPEYAKFWENFIGSFRSAHSSDSLLPFGLTGTGSQQLLDEQNNIHRHIVEAHYSQLIHVVRIPRLIKDLRAASSYDGGKDNIAEVFYNAWYIFYAIYAHMQSVLDLEMHIWRNVLRLKDKLDYQKVSTTNIPAVLESLKNRIRDKAIGNDVRAVFDKIGAIRNSALHKSRSAIDIARDEFFLFVPQKEIGKDIEPPLWEDLIKNGVRTKMDVRAEDDWTALLALVRRLRGHLIVVYAQVLTDKGLITQSPNPPATPPSPGTKPDEMSGMQSSLSQSLSGGTRSDRSEYSE